MKHTSFVLTLSVLAFPLFASEKKATALASPASGTAVKQTGAVKKGIAINFDNVPAKPLEKVGACTNALCNGTFSPIPKSGVCEICHAPIARVDQVFLTSDALRDSGAVKLGIARQLVTLQQNKRQLAKLKQDSKKAARTTAAKEEQLKYQIVASKAQQEKLAQEAAELQTKIETDAAVIATAVEGKKAKVEVKARSEERRVGKEC